jgi:HSP20 family protein
MTNPTDQFLAEFDRMRSRIHRTWHDMLGPPGSPRFCPPVIAPPVDVYETKESVVVVMEMAGINEQEVHISIAGDRLTIRGEREDRQRAPGRLYAQMEICCGAFERTITLPAELDVNKTIATYHDGFLEVVLPRVQRPPNRPVRIRLRKGREQA